MVQVLRPGLPEGLLLVLGLALGEGDGIVIERDITVLILGHIGDRIAQAQARNQQRQAAPGPQEHHNQPFFIAEDVPGRHLLEEAHMLPQGGHVLQ